MYNSSENLIRLVGGHSIARGVIGKGLSRNTIRNALCVVRGLFNYAIEDGLLDANPAARLGRFTRSAKKAKVKGVSLTTKEVEQFLKAAQDVRSEYYPLLLMAVRAGLRRGELCPSSRMNSFAKAWKRCLQRIPSRKEVSMTSLR